jgi:flavin prenyltransferase
VTGRHFAVAVTGASGAVYGLRLVGELIAGGNEVSVIITTAGLAVIKEECGIELGAAGGGIAGQLRAHFNCEDDRLRFYEEDDLLAPIASGSAAADVMIVAPCSMGTLSRLSCGNSGNLLERAADVMLKEGRPLLLVPRETPLNAIHLENMLKLARLGVKILPAMPGFYHHPQNMDDLVNFVVGKVLDSVGIEHRLFKRWGE